MWLSFWWRNSVSEWQQKFLFLEVASYKHWRIAFGQLIAIMMSSTNKASPFRLWLENLLHTIAQKPQNIVSYKAETCLVAFWTQYRHTCSIVSKGCTGTGRTGKTWKQGLKTLHKPLLTMQAICRRAAKTLLNQTRTSPGRQLSNSLTFQFLPVCSVNTTSSLTSELCECLNECSDYEYLQAEQYCPTQSMLKYKLMKATKSNGFPFPTALVTYTHENNVGNLNFLWKILGDEESAFSDGQRVVEQLKQHIPM